MTTGASFRDVLFSDIILSVSADKYYLECEGQTLTIDRVTHQVNVSSSSTSLSLDPSISSRKSVFGILGWINLVSGPALIVVTGKQKLGDLSSSNHGVYQLTSHEILPFARTENHLSPGQQKENAVFLQMLNQTLSTPNFYFAYSSDLSNTVQRKYEQQSNPGAAAASSAEMTPEVSVVGMFTKWDERFVWNRYLLEKFLFLGPSYLRFCLPVIHGAIFIRQCSINGKLFRWALISRRSNKRAGTRFTVRGCDDQGFVANFVETEQILELGGSAESSFVQTRGSIPLFWSQTPNVVVYKPDAKLDVTKSHLDGYIRHFMEQVRIYGQQIMINLIDHKKSEGALEAHIRSIHTTAGLKGVEYVAFDFHQECGGGTSLKWDDSISPLVNDLGPTLSRHGCFVAQGSGVEEKQHGVARTNCMDCLDRTNVVQSLLASENIQDVLSAFGILKEGQRISQQDQFQVIFRNVWADHADLLSKQYAGTGALKTDFTRTGKRTPAGLIKDLQNSLIRYYKNNFTDGFRQDAIDLFLGNYRVDESNAGRSHYSSTQGGLDLSWIRNSIPIFLLALLAMFCLTAVIAAEFDNGIILFPLFWIVVLGGMGFLVHRHAAELVDVPKLIPKH